MLFLMETIGLWFNNHWFLNGKPEVFDGKLYSVSRVLTTCFQEKKTVKHPFMQTTRKEAIIHHLWAWQKPSYVQLVSYIITNQSWDVWFWVLVFSEGSLEVKFPTIWTDGKAEVGRVREEKKQKKEDSGARKGRKVAIHCGSTGSKST